MFHHDGIANEAETVQASTNWQPGVKFQFRWRNVSLQHPQKDSGSVKPPAEFWNIYYKQCDWGAKLIKHLHSIS
jgi:hypothetical protein